MCRSGSPAPAPLLLPTILDYDAIVRSVLKRVGYDAEDKGMDFKSCSVINRINIHMHASLSAKQSPEDITATEQGIHQ